MTDAEREALVQRMAEAAVDAGLWPGAWAGGAALGHGYGGQVTPPMPEPGRYEWRRRMRAALSEAEKTIRADEREACAKVCDDYASNFRAVCRSMAETSEDRAHIEGAATCFEAASDTIRARGDA